MYAAKAARVPHGQVGRYARSHAMLHPQFGNPGLATQALIRVAKPSYTTGTLNASFANFFRIIKYLEFIVLEEINLIARTNKIEIGFFDFLNFLFG
jgi:hypothetical protein